MTIEDYVVRRCGGDNSLVEVVKSKYRPTAQLPFDALPQDLLKLVDKFLNSRLMDRQEEIIDYFVTHFDQTDKINTISYVGDIDLTNYQNQIIKSTDVIFKVTGQNLIGTSYRKL